MTYYERYLIDEIKLADGHAPRELISETSLNTFRSNGWNTNLNRIHLDKPVWLKKTTRRKGRLMIHEGFGNFIPFADFMRAPEPDSKEVERLHIRDVILWKPYDPKEYDQAVGI